MNRRLCLALISTVSLSTLVGCGRPVSESTPVGTGKAITSKGAITVKDGEVQFGKPKVTEDVEKEIYKSLNHRRKMIAAIQEGSGSKRGLDQMNDELELLTKGFMGRYDLTAARIEKILEKGDANGWE